MTEEQLDRFLRELNKDLYPEQHREDPETDE